MRLMNEKGGIIQKPWASFRVIKFRKADKNILKNLIGKSAV